MSFQQGLVVIVISIKCLYIYFLRNSTNFPHPRSFEKFQVIGKKNNFNSSREGDGSNWERLLFQKNYLFRKKQHFFSLKPWLHHHRNWGEGTGGAARRFFLQKMTKLAIFQNCPLSIILGCSAATTYILLCPSKKINWETIILSNLRPPPVPSLNPTVLFTF